MAGARCALEKTLKRIKMARMTALSCGRAQACGTSLGAEVL
jgi:hypothetical protein